MVFRLSTLQASGHIGSFGTVDHQCRALRLHGSKGDHGVQAAKRETV